MSYSKSLQSLSFEQKAYHLTTSDHCNDYCLLSLKGETEEEEKTTPAIWMCYAGGVGFGGYGGYEHYARRIRLYEVDTNEARITTWKRLEHGTEEELKSRFDEQIIVDSGRPLPPPDGYEPPPLGAGTDIE